MLLPVLALAAALASPGDSLSGEWKIEGDVMGNPLLSTCRVQQTADSLSGSCTGGDGSVQGLKGAVKDGKVTFQHGGDYQGTALTIIYTGTRAASGKLEGTVRVLPFDVDGTFSATPTGAKP